MLEIFSLAIPSQKKFTMKKITQILVLLTLFIYFSSLAQTVNNSFQPDIESNYISKEHNRLDVFSKTTNINNSKFTIGDVWAYGMLSGIYGKFPLVGPLDRKSVV